MINSRNAGKLLSINYINIFLSTFRPRPLFEGVHYKHQCTKAGEIQVKVPLSILVPYFLWINPKHINTYLPSICKMKQEARFLQGEAKTTRRRIINSICHCPKRIKKRKVTVVRYDYQFSATKEIRRCFETLFYIQRVSH